ncbi:MAG: lytic murein transglycosylase [Candidatus Pacearchaeota archaeon]|nr:lytic murein transglycosylase [Candidatus Pacearchaeota archaeon]
MAEQENKDIFYTKDLSWDTYKLRKVLLENISKFGVDFDKNGKIDLSTLPDAIGFVANYLSKAKYNWKRHNAIYIYNHSNIYCGYIIVLRNELKRKCLKRKSSFETFSIKEYSSNTTEKDKNKSY